MKSENIISCIFAVQNVFSLSIFSNGIKVPGITLEFILVFFYFCEYFFLIVLSVLKKYAPMIH